MSFSRRFGIWATVVTAFGAVFAPLAATGCKRSSAVSAEKAKVHVTFLKDTSARDLEEVRKGLPEGAQLLSAAFSGERPIADDPQALHVALERARSRVQDLRVAKSTFFAAVSPSGTVLRSDQEQDNLAGKDIFAAFPALRGALEGKYVETAGKMPELAGVRGRGDAEWVAATPIKVGSDLRAVYVTGWSWSAYAYRLENGLRSSVRSELAEGAKMPLLYVYVMVDNEAFGAPVSPDINAKAIIERAPLSKVQGEAPVTFELEITERDFGLAVQRAPALGPNVALAVLRSET